MAYHQQLVDALKEIEQLKAERDLWKARAFVLFWRQPDDAVIPISKEEIEKAKSILGLAGNPAKGFGGTLPT